MTQEQSNVETRVVARLASVSTRSNDAAQHSPEWASPLHSSASGVAGFISGLVARKSLIPWRYSDRQPPNAANRELWPVVISIKALWTISSQYSNLRNLLSSIRLISQEITAYNAHIPTSPPFGMAIAFRRVLSGSQQMALRRR
jgi:hypothetical protein